MLSRQVGCTERWPNPSNADSKCTYNPTQCLAGTRDGKCYFVRRRTWQASYPNVEYIIVIENFEKYSTNSTRLITQQVRISAYYVVYYIASYYIPIIYIHPGSWWFFLKKSPKIKLFDIRLFCSKHYQEAVL